MDTIPPATSQTTRVVVAIDFGTSRSGYAYAFVDDKDIKHNIEWPGSPVPSAKTLTELLYSPTKNVAAWGFMARRMLVTLPADEAGAHSLLQTFKMDLKAASASGVAPVRKLPNGQQFHVVEVIADYLKLIKDAALGRVKDATSGELRDDEILWCLTVPAIWTDHNKSVMRRAAHRAGIIEAEDSERLMLVLEPEAAAIYCQETAQFELKRGDSFMIVDCGGGTVDITAHEIAANGALSEIAPGTGGAYGSTYLDQGFKRYLGQKLGAPVLSQLERDEPLAFLELMEAWERIKCDFGPLSGQNTSDWRTGWKRRFHLGTALYKLLRKTPEVLDRLEEEQGADEYLELDYKVMESIFSPVMKQIAGKVGEELDRLNVRGIVCDYLLLVGGFAESPLLQQVIKARFKGDVGRVVVPSYPSAAIVQGAVSFGLSPQRIRARRSRLTYGWRALTQFDPALHTGKETRTVDGELYCTQTFATIVKAGESVGVDDVVSKRARPVDPNQKQLPFVFFASVQPNVRFTDEPGVSEVGTLTVAMPDTTGGKNREVEIKAFFGRTEIQVEATDLTSGNKAHASLRFSSTFSSEMLGH